MTKPLLAIIWFSVTLLTQGCSSSPEKKWMPHGKWAAVKPVEYAQAYCGSYAESAANSYMAGQPVPTVSTPKTTYQSHGYDIKAKCKEDAFGNYDCTGVAVPNVQSTLANSGASASLLYF